MTMLLLSLLLAATPVPAAADPAQPPAPPAKEKMICHKQVDTGSLIKGRRVCVTQSQFRRQVEDAQRNTATLQAATGNPGPQ